MFDTPMLAANQSLVSVLASHFEGATAPSLSRKALTDGKSRPQGAGPTADTLVRSPVLPEDRPR